MFRINSETMMNEKDEMAPMISILSKLTDSGYTTQFKVTPKGLQSMASQKNFKPKQVEIKHFYRFEGESDPGETSILYAIETKNGEKGTLVDSYGAYSDPLIEKFIKEVQSVTK